MRKRLIERNTPPEWNVRVMDEEDFWFHCGLGGILVLEVPQSVLDRLGSSMKRRGHNVISIRKGLRGADRLFVLLHELAHQWLHPPGVQHFDGWEKMVDREANAVAACAMIPLPVLLRFSITDIAENYNYPLSLVAERLMIYDRWKI